MWRARLVAVGVVTFLAGCGPLGARDPSEFAEGDRLTWAEYDAYREQVDARLAASPRQVLDMKEALQMLERMVATRPDDEASLHKATEVCLWLVQETEEDGPRRAYAEKGVHFGRAAVADDDWSAAGHYRLALALGYYAREDQARALSMIEEMEAEAKRAAEMDEAQSGAGPHRYLALLYAQAPGFPTSIGDIDLAYEHAERALEIAGDEPANHVAMAEVLLEDGEDEAAIERLETALELLEGVDGPGAERTRREVAALLEEIG